MAESETGQERTEEPTQKKLDEAKKKGQIARSRDLNTMAIMALAAVSFIMLGRGMVSDLVNILRSHLQPARADIFDVGSVVRFFYSAIFDALWLMTPFLLIMLVAVLMTPILMGGWSFSTEAIQPKLSKLNPIKGFAKMFSLKSLVEMIKTLAKFGLVTAIAVVVVWSQFNDFVHLGAEHINMALAHAGELFTYGFLLMTVALIIIASIDVPFQLWQHKKQLKMTLQEVKDEMKDTEGKPEVKSRVRQLQREMAQARMMDAVPDADVVITNPTHFAVALKYDQNNMKAPQVLAKGADLMAANIRRVALANDVLLVETPPLARALYYTTEIGEEVPHELYVAVAQILAYVYQLRNVQKNGGKKPTQPQPELPEAYQQYTHWQQ